MNKLSSFLCVLLAVLGNTFFTETVSAAAKYPGVVNIPGYKGRIGMRGGASIIEKGDILTLCIGSSEGHEEDLSRLNVAWNANPSEIKLTDKGFSKTNNNWEANVTFLKAGITVPVYASVNGIPLEREFNVWADPVHATKVALSAKNVSLYGKDQTTAIDVTLYPAGVPLIDGDDHPAVVTSHSDVVTGTFHRDPYPGKNDYILLLAKGDGTALITVKTRSGPYASCYVTVSGTGSKARTASSPQRIVSKGNNGASQNGGSSKTENSAVQSRHTGKPSASQTLPSGIHAGKSSISSEKTAGIPQVASSGVIPPDLDGTDSDVSSAASSGVIPPDFNGTDSDVSRAKTGKAEKEEPEHTFRWLFAVAAFLAAGTAGTVYFIKKRKSKRDMGKKTK